MLSTIKKALLIVTVAIIVLHLIGRKVHELGSMDGVTIILSEELQEMFEVSQAMLF